MPEENIGPSPRTTTTLTARVVGGVAEGVAEGQHHLAVHRVALLGARHHDVADGSAVLGGD